MPEIGFPLHDCPNGGPLDRAPVDAALKARGAQ